MIIGSHLDLKGVIPKTDYLKTYLKDLSEIGINTLLVEYEDIFPFAEPVDILFNKDSVWTKETLDQFLQDAAQYNIEIIPLQHCLGHLQYVFRWDKYRHLAENTEYPCTVKLSDPDAKKLMKEMVAQVLEAHPNSKYFHLGMDEARYLQDSCLVEEYGGVFPLMMAYLEEMIELVESYNKTPIIWGDMIEDYFEPGCKLFEKVKDRVIIMPWDYCSDGTESYFGRMHSRRMSKEYIKEPENKAMPPITGATNFVEDLSDELLEVIDPYYQNGRWKSMWQVDWLTKEGVRVLGASSVRMSSQGSVLPDFTFLGKNNTVWAEAILRNNQVGVIATSWGRGNTFCPPNFIPELSLITLAVLVKDLGGKGQDIWQGIDRERLQYLLDLISRCKSDWDMEAAALKLMDELEPDLISHKFEWKSLKLMVELYKMYKKIDPLLHEARYFQHEDLLIDTQWKRMINQMNNAIEEIARLRQRIQEHFSQRYHGKSFNEWLKFIFNYEFQLKQCIKDAEKKQVAATKLYC